MVDLVLKMIWLILVFILSHILYQIWEFRGRVQISVRKKKNKLFFLVWVSNELVMEVNGNFSLQTELFSVNRVLMYLEFQVK